MATVTFINFNNNVGGGIRLGPADHWDGYVENMGGNIFGGIFQGYSLNWGGFDSQEVINPFFNQPYSGYSSNWGGTVTTPAIDNLTNEIYIGYSTNWGQYTEPVERSINDVDNDTIVDHPKDQTIFYKLKGWNPNTNSYESWVISHNITARPSLDGQLFDPIPGRVPPNVERDVFKTPPSGNTLSNIIIVARWIE